jgi:transposase-like protein
MSRQGSRGRGSRRDPELERQWRHRVAAWRESGQTAREFCQTHGLSVSALYSWRRVLKQRDRERTEGASPFVAVDVTPPPLEWAPAQGTAPIEIVLGNGTRVLVNRGAMRRELAAVLGALDEWGSC